MLASLVLFVAIGPAAAQDPDEFPVETTPAVAPAPAATGSFAWPVGAVPNPVPAPKPPPKPTAAWPTGVVGSGSAREVAPAAVAAPVAAAIVEAPAEAPVEAPAPAEAPAADSPMWAPAPMSVEPAEEAPAPAPAPPEPAPTGLAGLAAAAAAVGAATSPEPPPEVIAEAAPVAAEAAPVAAEVAPLAADAAPVASEVAPVAAEVAPVAADAAVEAAEDTSWLKRATADVGGAVTTAWFVITGKKAREERLAAEAAAAEAAANEAAVPAAGLWEEAIPRETAEAEVAAAAAVTAGAAMTEEPAPAELTAPSEPEPAAVTLEEAIEAAIAAEVAAEVAEDTDDAVADVADEDADAYEAEDHDADDRHARHDATDENPWRFSQHTVFGLKRRSGRFGMYMGLTGLVSQYGDDGGGAWGLEGGVTLGPFILGAAGYGSGSVDWKGNDARFAYGGFQPGLILWSGKLVHPRFDLLLGGGALVDGETGQTLGAAGVIVPRLGAELNLTRAIRLSGNLGYRFVGAPGDARGAFSGFEGGLTFRFGWL